MKLFTTAIVALLLLCDPALARSPGRSRLGPWRPSLSATANATTITPGQTIVVAYNATNATSVQAAIHQFGQWVGWSDGVVMPATSGSFTVTPAQPGEYVITVAAWRRRADLNRDGKSDGHRRSVTVEIPITVR